MSSTRNFLLILVVVLNFTATIYAQLESSKRFYYYGKVISKDNKPLVFAHIVNINRNYATITDSTGYFKIPAFHDDSIMITSIGFYTKHVLIVKKNSGTAHIITLDNRNYNLPIVNINEIRWQIFKSEFMEKRIKENEIKKRISNWMNNLVPLDEIEMIWMDANRKDWLYLDKYKK